MRQAIRSSDVRKGDLIRWEREEEIHQWRAEHDGDFYSGVGQHYLVDRPSPDLGLTQEPKLGWITQSTDREGDEPRLGFFATSDHAVLSESPSADEYSLAGSTGHIRINTHYRVTNFTEAVAVPKDVLAALSEAHLKQDSEPDWDVAGMALDKALDQFFEEVSVDE